MRTQTWHRCAPALVAALLVTGVGADVHADARHSVGRAGRLAPEVIQRVMRAAFPRFRRCFEDGLRGCPNLQERVVVRFVIGEDGRVASARDAGSNLPDARVVACVVGAFRTLRFPPPAGGRVTVVYPLLFRPGA
jgi:hypothetical protein